MTDPTSTPPPRRTPLQRALRAGALAALATLLAALLAACAGPLTNPPRVVDGPTEHPTEFAPTLVASYYYVSEHSNDDGTVDLRANYSRLQYRPRGSDYAGYEGWDLLETRSSDSSRSDWLRINLNRDAEVAVLWEESAGWLSGWRRVGEVAGKSVWRRSFEAGQIQLGAPGEGKGEYEVLIAERGGAPSEAPPMPEGWSGAAPQPNAACPDALHNLWLAEGPNGRFYGGWHPQIDPVYWCYYGHEHGTDPSLVGYTPAFRYVADQNSDQREQHEGFKGFGIRDVEADNGKRYHWYVNIHMTTSDIGRVCARQHTVVLAVVDAETNELMAELGYKGEYGSIKNNENNDQILQPQLAGCPDQRAIESELDAAGLNMFKEVRVIEGDSGNRGYEQWRGGLNETLGMDFRGDTGMHVDIRNPVTGCAGASCAQGVRTGSNGTRRTIRFSDLEIDGSSDLVRLFDQFDGERDGVFYTDQYGKDPVASDAPNAIRQYIAPGFRAQLDGGFETEDAWRALYIDDSHVQDLELEGGFGDIITN